MAKCPSCTSKRLRIGYRRTPFLLRLLLVRTLLCDNCNCEFRAFSPFPPRKFTRRSTPLADHFQPAAEHDLSAIGQPGKAVRTAPRAATFDRNALPVNLSAGTTAVMAHSQLSIHLRRAVTEASATPNQGQATSLNGGKPALLSAMPPPSPAINDIGGDDGAVKVPNTSQGMTQSALPLSATARVPAAQQWGEDWEAEEKQQSQQTCPKCGSHETHRRHRKLWERKLLGIANVRPYFCENCAAVFYARSRRR